MFHEGVREDEDGVAYRQIPIFHSKHSSLWSSETGIVKRLYHNVFNNTYTWGSALKIHEVDGKLFIHTDKKTKLTLEKAVASAWSDNPYNKRYAVMKNFCEWKWVDKKKFGKNFCDEVDDEDEGTDEDESSCEDEKHGKENIEDEDGVEDEDIVLDGNDDEEWKILKDNNLYQISSKGRFKSHLGEVCEATFCRNKKVICIPEVGVIDVEDYINKYFHKRKSKRVLGKRLGRLYVSLKKGVPLEVYAEEKKLKMSTVWNYMYELVQILKYDECKFVIDRYITDSTKYAMMVIFENECEYIFSQPASQYMHFINLVLKNDEDWSENIYKYEEIRVMKSICQKLCEK